MANVLNEIFAVFDPFSRREDSINNLFLLRLGFSFNGSEVSLLLDSE